MRKRLELKYWITCATLWDAQTSDWGGRAGRAGPPHGSGQRTGAPQRGTAAEGFCDRSPGINSLLL